MPQDSNLLAALLDAAYNPFFVCCFWDDRVVVNTFGDGDWKGVLDHLREHHLIDAANAPLSGPGLPVVGRPVREPASARERLRGGASPVGRGRSARPIAVGPAYRRLRGMTGDLPGPLIAAASREVPVYHSSAALFYSPSQPEINRLSDSSLHPDNKFFFLL